MYILDGDPSALSAWIRDEITFPGEFGRGKRGNSAKRAQEWLCLHGFGLVIDGDFGRVSEDTVMRFQFDLGLHSTGKVDEPTWTALVQPMLDVLVNPLLASMSFGDAVAEFANQHLIPHPREVGGQNAGPWVRLYMKGNEGRDMPWCAGYVSFCLHQASEALMHPMPMGTSFSCDNLARNAQDTGLFLRERDASADQIPMGSVFLRRSDPLDWTHTGIVTHAAQSHYETNEGNTNDEGSREGYEVCTRRRGYSNTDFIVF
ncbi:peptidoglycan-binding protein [Pseudosulfitobacter sp. SM2401]|uniref:peptidoglycan-binding domain-containing protein n=1 Tax=Pseudosulfitobacter sp. SM2401 TaxID=3350098 RepID=UPI0036F2F579